MEAIFAKMLYEMEKGISTVLVSIVNENGSSPRGAGAQMLVDSNGLLVGSVGGGAIEFSSIRIAKECLTQKASVYHKFELHPNSEEDIGMVCGGNVDVFFQYIDGHDPKWASLASELLNQIKNRVPGLLILHSNGSVATISPVDTSLSDGSFGFQIPIGERAVIFGAGHISAALTPILSSVGFRVTVMDERPEFVTRERFPLAETLICGDFTKLHDFLSFSEQDYLVIMTNGHSHDFDVEHQVLQGPYLYVGVIGSRSKTAAVNQLLRNAGISEQAIQSVHTPIGTAIKAVTPAEIAVSIAGEMILERALHRESGVQNGCPMH